MKKKQLRRIEYFLHFLTAILVLIKATDEIKRRLYFPALILFSLGLAVLVISLFYRKMGIRPKQARQACWYIESPALLLISYMLHLENKDPLAQLFLLASILYPMVGFISSKRFKKLHKSSQ